MLRCFTLGPGTTPPQVLRGHLAGRARRWAGHRSGATRRRGRAVSVQPPPPGRRESQGEQRGWEQRLVESRGPDNRWGTQAFLRDRTWAIRPPRELQEFTLRVDAAAPRSHHRIGPCANRRRARHRDRLLRRTDPRGTPSATLSRHDVAEHTDQPGRRPGGANCRTLSAASRLVTPARKPASNLRGCCGSSRHVPAWRCGGASSVISLKRRSVHCSVPARCRCSGSSAARSSNSAILRRTEQARAARCPIAA